jgi:4-hydroxybenzoate polyprenyltransferase
MPASGAAQQEPYLPPRFVPVDSLVSEAGEWFPAIPVGAVRALAWAVLASTVHRVRRGEGVLLAVNVSLMVLERTTVARALMQACVSTLAILVMYAFNDLYDAPVDWNNPKKDRRLIATWVAHRKVGVVVAVLLKMLTLGAALALLGRSAAAAVASVMVVNVVYSTMLKGVPVADIVAVGVWGMLYAAIVGAAPSLIVVVGLMTAICHLFQVLDDREPDAANGIQTTAVRSASLSRDVLVALSLVLVAVVLPYLGVLGALTAFVPLAIFFAVDDAGSGWLLTKAYFAVMWLSLLWSANAVA